MAKWMCALLVGWSLWGCTSQKQYFRGVELSRLGPWIVEVRNGPERERFHCSYQMRTGSHIKRMRCRSQAQIHAAQQQLWQKYGRR